MHTSAQALPPYRALLVVDIRDFSGREGRHHEALTASVPEVLESAFNRCGLRELWTKHRFGQTTGDGYAAGFTSDLLPFLLNPFLPALQEELADRNASGWPQSPGKPVQMRVSVNVGPMTDSGLGRLGDGSGASRIENHRVLDSDPVRQLLSRSAPATCVAAAITERTFIDAVQPGYSAEDPALYVPAPVTVKTYTGKAYLRVPKPSGSLLTEGFLTRDEEFAPKSPNPLNEVPPPATSTVVHNSSGPMHTGHGQQFVNYTGHVSGGINQGATTPRSER